MKKKFMSRSLSRITIFVFISALIIPFMPVHAEGVDALKPEAKHALSGRVVAKLLRQFHYNHQQMSDEISSEMLDLYVEQYDPNRLYFLASDIEKFEQFRFTLDDDIRDGNVDAAYIIFNTLTSRIEQRLFFVKNRLKKEFYYTINETYQLDRTEQPWAQSVKELDDLWRKKLKNEALNLRLAGKDWPGAQTTLNKRYENLERRIAQYKSEDVFQNFMNALSETYDPHTSYFSPISSENFGIDMSLSLEGIGAQLSADGDYTKVVRIIVGGPADRSKELQANDKIIGVAQGLEEKMVDVIGMRLDDVVQKIRGPKNSIVRLEVIPADVPAGGPTKEIILVRDKVVLEERAAQSDTVEIEQDGNLFKLGVITLPSFYVDLEAQRRHDPDFKSTTRDVRRLIGELEEAGIDGLIIDLRRNGGGSLQEAIELTGLFIEDGPVVQVKSYVGSKKVESDPDPSITYSGPLAVLVGRFSASASEIFSSAIQDYGRGLVVGNQTYGKGTVQNLLGLNRFIKSNDEKYGQLKVTVAKFYRITGSSTQHRGVIPDISFPSIYNEMDFGEDKQIHALPWDEISPAMSWKQGLGAREYDQVSMFLSKLRLNSKKRTAKNREFKYIQEDIDEYILEKDRNAIFLKESVRKAKRDETEKRRFLRADKRRADKGFAPLKEGEKIPAEDKAPDAILNESKRILSDLIFLSNPDKAAYIAKTGKKTNLENEGKSTTVRTDSEKKNRK